jgi:hypothetical protein
MSRLAPLLVLLLAGACQDDEPDETADGGPGDRTDALSGERISCVDRINGFRATLDLAPLGRWRDIEACADSQAEQDSKSGHPHGAFGDCGEMAQNECPGWGSLDDIIEGCLQAMWDEGPGADFNAHGHYINMSNPDYTRVACGFYTTADGQVWAVQDFR